MNTEADKVEIPFTQDELAALLEVVTPALPDVDRALVETPDLLHAWVLLAEGARSFKMKTLDEERPALRLVT